MRRDHFCFGLLLTLLFIAPRVPIGAMLEGAPPLSTLSLGFVGLLFWLLASPRLVLNFGREATQSSWGILVVFFAVYVWFVSAFSGSTLSMLYATQYLFYSLFGFLILGAYLRKASIRNELDRTFGIFIAIGIIYSLGGLVSLFIGPIYPHQTLWTARRLGDFYIQQGVGFGVNQNAVGGVLFFFLAASIFLYPRHWRWQLLTVGIMGLALLATLSRSAIFSFGFGSISLLSIWSLRALFIGKINRRLVRHAVAITFLTAGIFVAALFGHFLFLSPPQQRVVLAALSGFGVGDYLVFYEDMVFRLELWSEGLLNWWFQEDLSVLFGVGFRNSVVIGKYGAWITPHNFYIAVLGDFGLFGLLMVISILLGFVWSATLKILTNRRKLGIPLFGSLTILAFSVHNLSETFLYSPLFVILLLFALQLLSVNIEQPSRKNRLTIGEN